jgi:antitoxin ParD1/3/4
MQTMNISLSDHLKKVVDDEVASGRYSSASEYVRELIRNEEKRKAREKLESLLLEGVRGGGSAPFTQAGWDELRREALRQFEARQSKNRA